MTESQVRVCIKDLRTIILNHSKVLRKSYIKGILVKSLRK